MENLNAERNSKRKDVEKLLSLAARGNGKDFTKTFLEIMDKYGLFEKIIRNVNKYVDGQTAIQALTGTDLNETGHHTNPFLVKYVPGGKKASEIYRASYYSEVFGPFRNHGSYWVRTDFKAFFTSELKKLDLCYARTKIFVTNPLGFSSEEVDGMIEEIAAKPAE